jgi:hypothetical protein
VEDHPGHIPHRAHRGPDARGNGALARAPVLPAICRGRTHHSGRCGITEAAARGVSFFVGVDPTLVVMGGIVMLVAGMTIVGAAQDAIDQFYVTASARLLDVIMRTAGIVVGIIASLELAWRLGAPLSISPNPVEPGPLGAQFVGAALTSAFCALWAYADLATIGLAGAMGLLGWAGYALMIYVGANEVPANTLGAFCRGAGLHLADPPNKHPWIRAGQRCSAPVGTRPLPLPRSSTGSRHLPGDSQSECRWNNSVGRSRRRFGHSGRAPPSGPISDARSRTSSVVSIRPVEADPS